MFQLSRIILEPVANLIQDKYFNSSPSRNRSAKEKTTLNLNQTVSNYSQAATLALNELVNLENQILSHMKWKEMRMLEMGWIFDDYQDHFSQFQKMLTTASASVSAFNNSTQNQSTIRASSPFSQGTSMIRSRLGASRSSTPSLPSTTPIPQEGNPYGQQVSPKAMTSQAIASNDMDQSSISAFSPIRKNPDISTSFKDDSSHPSMNESDKKMSSHSLISAEKAMMLYDSLKAKLFSILTPQEIATSKIIIRLLGFLDVIRPQLQQYRQIHEQTMQLSNQTIGYMHPYEIQQQQLQLLQQQEQLQLLYDSIKTILRSFNEEKRQSRRRSTFLWSYHGSKGGNHSEYGDQERKMDDPDPSKSLGRDQRDYESSIDEDSSNYFYTHPRLRKLHKLLFKSADTLIKLGVIVNDFNPQVMNHEQLTSPSKLGTKSLTKSGFNPLSVISQEKIKDIINIHRDLQNLLMPFDAASAIATFLSSLSDTSASLQLSNQTKDSSIEPMLTGNLVLRVTSHLDGQSLASLLLISSSTDLINNCYKTLHGLTVSVPRQMNPMNSSNDGIIYEYDYENDEVIPAENLNIMNLDLMSALSCRMYGFLCSELRASKLFHNYDILQAKYPLKELVGMNFNVDDLRMAGYTVQQCKAIGLDAAEIRAGIIDDILIVCLLRASY